MFSLSNIRPDVSIDMRNKYKVKRMKFFTNKDNKPKFENKCLSGVILHVKAPTQGAAKTQSTYNQNKKVRVPGQGGKNYHRWFLVGDLKNPPHTYAIVTHSHKQTWDFLHHVHDEPFVGMPFYLIEPGLSTSRVGDYLHVVDYTKEKMIPLKTDCRVLKKPAGIQLPNSSEETFYFVLENQQIQITKMGFSFDTCCGYQCDRQKCKDECVCAFGAIGNPFVYELDVLYPVDKEQFKVDHHVTTLSSFRTTNIFFHNISEYSQATTKEKEEKYLYRRRSQVRRLCQYINDNGGFRLVGWVKKGLLQIDGEIERVESKDVNLHLSFMYPQNEKILEDETFKSLQIREDFESSDEELPNLLPGSQEQSDDSDSDDDDNGNDDAGVADDVPAAPPATTENLAASENHSGDDDGDDDDDDE